MEAVSNFHEFQPRRSSATGGGGGSSHTGTSGSGNKKKLGNAAATDFSTVKSEGTGRKSYIRKSQSEESSSGNRVDDGNLGGGGGGGPWKRGHFLDCGQFNHRNYCKVSFEKNEQVPSEDKKDAVETERTSAAKKSFSGRFDKGFMLKRSNQQQN